jgi:hypothetical protein
MKAADVNPPLKELPPAQTSQQPVRKPGTVKMALGATVPPPAWMTNVPPGNPTNRPQADVIDMARGWGAFSPRQQYHASQLNTVSPETMNAAWQKPRRMFATTVGSHLNRQFNNQQLGHLGNFISSIPQMRSTAMGALKYVAPNAASRLGGAAGAATGAAASAAKMIPGGKTIAGIVGHVNNAANTGASAVSVLGNRVPAVAKATAAVGQAARAIPAIGRPLAGASGFMGRMATGPAMGLATIGAGVKDIVSLASGHDSLDGGNLATRIAEVRNARNHLNNVIHREDPNNVDLNNYQFQQYAQDRLKPSFMQRALPGANGQSYMDSVHWMSPVKNLLGIGKATAELPGLVGQWFQGNRKLREAYKTGPQPQWVKDLGLDK